jgi:serine/threonine protein kinase
MSSFASIFEGLKSLAIKNYVHHDIKLDNILYDIDKNRFILIDFGFLVNISKTYNTNAFLFKDPHNLTFKYFPPEYNIMYFAYTNKTSLSSNDIYNINLYEFFSNFMSLIKKAMSNHRLPDRYKDALEKISDTIEDYVYNKSKEVLKLFKEASEDKIQPTEKAIDEYLRTVSNLHSTNQIDIRLKIDSYMLGLFLLSVIVNSFIYLDEKNEIYEIPVKLFDLLLKMIDINPFTRIDIFDATDEYKKIFKSSL